MSEERKLKVKASQHDSFVGLTILAVLLPAVGVIVGIVYLTKDKPVERKLGEHLVAIGVLMTLVAGVSYFILMSVNRASSAIDGTSIPAPVDRTPTPATPAWDVDAEYAKVSTGMTQQAVEDAIGMKPNGDCIQQNINQTTQFSSCTYGEANQGGAIIVTYENGVVSQKQDMKY